ncbi:MAG: MinD/ParA family protein [Candidatus Parvarchaeota archaeon]|nr:MinD/ParA family protein [Candidatus Haiyanarchaeum thermophilum]MCW1306928.1 MinD/ParA family protein [Candidatus Haiyanarchaeum thermophilum]
MREVGRVIGILSGKGGVGKSTLTANLAIQLARLGKEVIAIDCNLTTSHLGLLFGFYDYPVTLNQVLRGDYEIEDAIYEHKSGVKIIPGSLSPRDLYGVDLLDLRLKLSSLVGKNDFVLLDGAPGLGREAISAILCSQEVMLVAIPTLSSVLDVLRVKAVVGSYNIPILGVVVNMYEKRYKVRPEEIGVSVNLPILATIPYDKELIESNVFKIPVSILNPKARSSREFEKLAKKLVGMEEKVGIFQKIKSLFVASS